MPIEIRELVIKANVYPDRQPGETQATLTPQALEKLKQEIRKELLAELKQQWQQQKFER